MRAIRSKQNIAHMAVSKAIKSGEMTRLEVCQVCGRNPSTDKRWWHGLYDYDPLSSGTRYKMTIAHHWRGYDYPLDVWWVCYSCNRKLRVHDGSVSLQQAKEVINGSAFEWFGLWERAQR